MSPLESSYRLWREKAEAGSYRLWREKAEAGCLAPLLILLLLSSLTNFILLMMQGKV